MRKLVIICVMIFFVAACSSRKKIVATTESLTITSDEINKGRDLVAGSNCSFCHKVEEELTGPAFKKIANRYSPNSIPTLIKKIQKGGKGNWGEIYMTPHGGLSDADATLMLKFILSLKN